jgi:hypothetical protein
LKLCQNYFHSVCSVLLEPTEIGGEAKSNIISVDGVANPAAELCTDTKVTDVKCNPAGEENEMHSKYICI